MKGALKGAILNNKSHLFRDKLKTPGYLSQLDVARIRKIAGEATEQEFEEHMTCSTENAKRILHFWEIAQIELWDAEILKHFFHEWIYANRALVTARIQAAIFAGRLPERFTPAVGLQWLESENVLIGMMGHWVKANARARKPLHAEAVSLPEPQAVAVTPAKQNGLGWDLKEPQRFQGYRWPLYQMLKTAHTAGKNRPGARDVLSAWGQNRPPEVSEVMSDGLKFYDAQGSVKIAALKAIQQSINNLLFKQSKGRLSAGYAE